MEAGNREEEDRLGLGLGTAPVIMSDYSHLPPLHHHGQHHIHAQDFASLHHQHADFEHRHPVSFLDSSSPPTVATNDPRSQLGPTQISPSRLPHTNPHAATADAFAANDLVFDALNADDFYRSYRGVEHNSIASPNPEDDEFMAASTSRLRDNSSLRPNANGTIPKHPVVPASARNGIRTNLRSVSAPMNNDKPAFPRPGATSVKDLKKKFDQTVAASPTAKAPIRSGLSQRSTPSASPVSKLVSATAATAVGGAQPSYSSLRTSTDRDLGLQERGSQRSKFVPEDQTSSNTQSFASRVSRPRHVGGGNPLASKSMTHLPHKSAAQQSPAQPASGHSAQPLLFGEILPEQRDTLTVGYGIEGARPRRTSDSSLLTPSPRQQTFGDDARLDVRPDWHQANGDETKTPSTPRTHYRTNSDHSGTPRGNQAQVARPPNTPSSASRLPVSARKVNSPPGLQSPPGSRAASRTASRAASPNLKRTQVNGKLSRSTTPTEGRAKTPTQNSRRAVPQAISTSTSGNGTRLNAIISPPPPKLSPPLRSSRPRQPVSLASTTSSRLKQADRPKSPSKSSRNGTKAEELPRRRKLSVGPIDFEKRRETIKLAYTKSIRNSQVSQAKRQQAAIRKRTRELEVIAGAGAAAISGRATGSGEQPQITLDRPTPEHDDGPLETAKVLPQPISALTESRNHAPAVGEDADSPTLGIPGSFPAMSPPMESGEIPVPQSAVSTTSVNTEFDNEPQSTFEPHPPAEDILVHEASGALNDGSGKRQAERPKTEYQYPFDDDAEEQGGDDRVTMTIALDTTEARKLQQAQPEPAEPAEPPAPGGGYDEPSVPGAFKDEYDIGLRKYDTSQFETTVRMLRRESGISESQQSSAPFPDYEFEDPEYRLKLDNHAIRHIHRDEDANTDICTDIDENDNENERTAEYYMRMYGGGDSSNRESSCISSDADLAMDQNEPTIGLRRSPGTSHGLAVPSMLLQGNRSSQLSSYTDFSVESSEHSERPRSYKAHTSPLTHHAAMFGDASGTTQLPGLDGPHSRVHSFASDHQLPELDTGGGFSIPYLGKKPLTESPEDVEQPTHSPPPVPHERRESTMEARITPPGSFYEHPGQSSTLASRRASEVHTVSTDNTSLGGADAGFSDKIPVEGEPGRPGLSGKERQRLVQRRNVIKELIDTEAVFVRDMSIVEEIYKGTAEACPKLDSKTIKLIFRNTHEIIGFHFAFLTQLKEAVAPVYTMAGRKSPLPKDDSSVSESVAGAANSPSLQEPDDEKDRLTSIGPIFKSNMDKMKSAHEAFLRNSDHAAKRLIQIQQDQTVKVWLNECNEVAKDLTAAWDLDSLLIKPMQRICKYPTLIITLLQHTPQDHPDRAELVLAKDILETAIVEINKTKKNFELVGQIVGRKRKESDVKAGFARAFGKRVDKLQASGNRPPEDEVYARLQEKFGDDYLRLQVVYRDVEFYTRQVAAYVHEFLQYLSSMELVMRLQESPYPELQSKWVQFNVGMRDIEKVALEQHVSSTTLPTPLPFHSSLATIKMANPNTLDSSHKSASMSLSPSSS